MEQHARAIYENGTLRLLDTLDLNEGETVSINVIVNRKPVRESLRHLMLEIPDSGEDVDENALLAEMDKASKGVTLSDIILEEREQGW